MDGALGRLGQQLLTALREDGRPSKPRLALLQALLRKSGEHTGEIDGLAGPQTESAVARFRRAQGLGQGPLIQTETFAALLEKVGLSMVDSA